MGIEGGSGNNEVQTHEINQANNEQIEQNNAEHHRSGEQLEANSTIDNEGERKQVEGKDDATDNASNDKSNELDDQNSIEDEHLENDASNETENMQSNMDNLDQQQSIDGSESEMTGTDEANLENNNRDNLDTLDGNDDNESEPDEIPENENSESQLDNDNSINSSEISDGEEKSDSPEDNPKGDNETENLEEKTEEDESVNPENKSEDDKTESHGDKIDNSNNPDLKNELGGNIFTRHYYDGKSSPTIDMINNKIKENPDVGYPKDINDFTDLKQKTVADYNHPQDGAKKDVDGKEVMYTESEKNAMRDIRDSIEAPNKDTVMQKVIGKDDMDLSRYTDFDKVQESKDKYGGILGGFTAKAEDAAPYTKDYDTMREANRLDYLDRDGNYSYPEAKAVNNPGCYVMRYLPQEPDCSKFKVPYGEQFSDSAADAKIADQPFTGNGFTGSENAIIPEYELQGSIMPSEGAIYHVDENGKETLYGIFDSDEDRFVPLSEINESEE